MSYKVLILQLVICLCVLYVQQTDARMQSLGCYKDKAKRDLPHKFMRSSSLTPHKCFKHCKGYKFMGLQYSKECFCGNKFGSYGKSPKGCRMPCTGNKKVNCGGRYHNHIYQIKDFKKKSVRSFVGCYKDKRNRDMKFRFLSSSKMTYAMCEKRCKGYKYMGLQYGKECFCSNSYGKYGKDPKGCKIRCHGTKGQVCGGHWHNSVYRIKKAKKGTHQYVGCYHDKRNRDLKHKFVSTKKMNHGMCEKHCKGYKYMGLQYGKECFCSNSYGKYGKDPKGCKMRCHGAKGQICGGHWHNSVYRIKKVVKKGTRKYVGCYHDKNNRDLKHKFLSTKKMNHGMCQKHCKGYKYMGLQNSVECFCGNKMGSYGKDMRGCKMRCSGNNKQICGDKWHNSIYSL